MGNQTLRLRAKPPRFENPQPTPMGNSSFIDGGTCARGLAASTVVAKARGAIKLMKWWRMVNDKSGFAAFVKTQNAQNETGNSKMPFKLETFLIPLPPATPLRAPVLMPRGWVPGLNRGRIDDGHVWDTDKQRYKFRRHWKVFPEKDATLETIGSFLTEKLGDYLISKPDVQVDINHEWAVKTCLEIKQFFLKYVCLLGNILD